jgi:2-polyprenyl-6-methoxyphenol hydroxylase-like FAD-dependent oxidoreductase
VSRGTSRTRAIAVVGAGVAGLAAGIALSRAGNRVTLYERFSSSRPIGSGLMLQPTGLAALERYGLRQEIEALGARIDRLHGETARGARIFDLAYADLHPSHYAVGIHRAALHRALWSAFATSDAAFETNRTIVDFEASSDRRARLAFATGDRSPLFDLVVDASGAGSRLRGADYSGGAARFQLWARCGRALRISASRRRLWRSVTLARIP